MRFARQMRNLSAAERSEAQQVFKDSLPSWQKIFITDGLGPIPMYDNPYTEEEMGIYLINVGPAVYPDATLNVRFGGFGTYRAILIHEMTHVWQYYHGYHVVLRSIWANTLGAGYGYTVGAAWDDYNVEQQARIVEHWYVGGMSVTDARYPYIDKIIRPGVGNGFFSTMLDHLVVKLTADELRRL